MSTIRALLVDDEPAARRRLRQLLAAHPHVEVVGDAGSVAAAAAAVARLRPELVFLDVQLLDGTGFELFERVEVSARVIFVTAHAQHAVRAFEVNALDYLVKPVAPERLARALQRVGTPPASSGARFAADDVVCLRSARGLRFVHLAEVTHISALDDYSEVHTEGGAAYLSDSALRTWQDVLPASFVRVHRSTIVDTRRVERFERTAAGHRVCLRGVDQPLAVGRTFVAAFLARTKADP